MPMERCSLCGGKLDGNKICTECGMDNKKSDKYYRLNENRIQDVREQDLSKKSGGEPYTPPVKENIHGKYAGKYGNHPVFPNQKQFHGPVGHSNSNTVGKVVFVVFLLFVIWIVAMGFVTESEKQEDPFFDTDMDDILNLDIDLDIPEGLWPGAGGENAY